MLPIWTQGLQLAGTFAVAIFVAIIAYRQWKTAHQRLVFDLFERRMKLYDDARNALGVVLRTGNAPNDQIAEFSEVSERAKFLFGDEVYACTDKTRSAIITLQEAKSMLQSGLLTPPERAQHAARAGECMQSVARFYSDFPRLLIPYVRMTQKMH
jgi:hypothetical protein